ncbi:MAG: hypothetical protein IT373_00825 [Polyangiaceae bacterium]|nr:hypothetical protein [Polyangiaceae bacterium]
MNGLAAALGPCALVCAAAGAACVPAPALPYELPAGPAGLAVWRQARSELEALRRRARPATGYKMEVVVDFEHRPSGTHQRARGAVAVGSDALRMILLGPGGTTALDVWMCRDAFRMSVPAADLEVRGTLHDEPERLRALPVGFLGYWFLRPYAGSLLAFVPDGALRRFVLRDGDAVVDVRLEPGPAGAPERVTLRRRAPSGEELFTSDGASCGAVRYREEDVGLELAVECLGLDRDAELPEAAFADPDDPERACAAEMEP